MPEKDGLIGSLFFLVSVLLAGPPGTAVPAARLPRGWLKLGVVSGVCAWQRGCAKAGAPNSPPPVPYFVRPQTRRSVSFVSSEKKTASGGGREMHLEERQRRDEEERCYSRVI